MKRLLDGTYKAECNCGWTASKPHKQRFIARMDGRQHREYCEAEAISAL